MKRRVGTHIEITFDGAVAPKNPGGTGAWAYTSRESVHRGPITMFSEGAQGSGTFPPGPDISNNLMEYEALARALGSIQTVTPGLEITATGDSKLVIEQMSGRWRVGGGSYIPARKRALTEEMRLKLLGAFITYVWVPREENYAADELTKHALESVGVVVPLFERRRGPM